MSIDYVDGASLVKTICHIVHKHHLLYSVVGVIRLYLDLQSDHLVILELSFDATTHLIKHYDACHVSLLPCHNVQNILDLYTVDCLALQITVQYDDYAII